MLRPEKAIEAPGIDNTGWRWSLPVLSPVEVSAVEVRKPTPYSEWAQRRIGLRNVKEP